MSPASLRRYRAERLLREEFRSLRASVIASARGRLRACGAQLDDSDLEACYAQAWQGLYAATLEGQSILNPAGWLAVVTFRRAIDEHRARSRVGLDGACAGAPKATCCRAERAAAHPEERDVATQLHERMQLRHLFEALRLHLSDREQQAAALCYLQGVSRAQAARTMGVSEARMRKLMEGRGVGRPGVAAKVAALAETVRAGEWCEEQGSLMRGLAYGVLDPQGERHRLALAHASGCPACRAYVASLRGLAALLPPMPSLLPLLLAAGTGAKSTAVGAASAASQAGGAGAALPAPVALSSGAAGAAGAGAAGGGWLMASGGLSAKLAAGCLLALGVGASCAVLGTNRGAATVRTRIHSRARVEMASPAPARASAASSEPTGALTPAPGAVGLTPAAAAPSGATRATREFGLEQSGAESSAATGVPASAPRPAAARIASAGGEFARQAPRASSPGGGEGAPTRSASGASPAQREFSPG